MTKLSSAVSSKLSEAAIEQLQRRNISTVVEFIDEDPERLTMITGLSFKDVLEVRKNILLTYGGRIKNAADMLEIEKNNITPTNILSLDNLLKGGLYPGQIYEVCGLSSSGKTQLCFTVAANVALKSDNIVRYIDTKRDFCGSRVEQILSKKSCSEKIINETLERIKVCCVYNIHQLFKVLRWLTVALKEENEKCRTKILIIDSLPAVIFKSSKDRRITIALNHLANICHFIANEFRLSIITVNLITQWNADNEEGSSAMVSNPVTPTLGKYWSHVPNTRLLLEKGDPGKRKISIWKSHQLESNLACNLAVTDCGIVCC